MRIAETSPSPLPSECHNAPATFSPISRAGKIAAAHLEKLAVVYVRQSSPQQVLENRESTARQYALVDFASVLGWPSDRVMVIDEDQGQSGRSATGRLGFQRLLAEVTMDHVGLILSLEMSRLARSDKDWHHLLELCGVFGTLLADQDGVYDAADPNDRLLLGLKGTMSSLELQTMRNRLDKGKLSKARRGELFCSVPFGYVRLPTGKVAFDPDEQARSVVQLLFDKFDELGTIYALQRWLVNHGILLPIRPRHGAKAGQLEWRRPVASTLDQMLHHPMYAGAYAYGRRPLDRKRHYATGKGASRGWVPMDQWQVLLRDHLPAYITWERYLSNLERMKQNRSTRNTLGAPRQGRALLCGLLVCARCQWRMRVSYQQCGKPHYGCRRHYTEGSASCGCGVAAISLDELVVQQALRALEPAALELSLKAQASLGQERDRLERHWQQTLQRARYEVEAAERRYRAVDAQNRLVAATLERQWEEALRQERQAQEDHDRFLRQPLTNLSVAQEASIAALASDIPALWHSAQTTTVDRMTILRCLIQQVTIHAERNSEQAEVTIQWAGGFESHVSFRRPVSSYAQLRDGEQLLKRVAELHHAGNSGRQIAEALNEEGFLPIDPRERFTADIVRGLCLKLELRGEMHDDALLKRSEWWLSDLAAELKMPWRTLHGWVDHGWVHGRQTRVRKLWILWADADEMHRLHKLRAARARGLVAIPDKLLTPKQR